jgi:hypothetical protein
MSSNGNNKPATTLESILAHYREVAQNKRALGDSFERLVVRISIESVRIIEGLPPLKERI